MNEINYEDTRSSITKDDLENQTKEIVNELSKHITDTTLQSKEELKRELFFTKKEIISLHNEMSARETAIEELLVVRKNTKNVYYAGFFIGLLGIIAGIFSNIIYFIAGLGVALTALVGIYEAKKNNW